MRFLPLLHKTMEQAKKSAFKKEFAVRWQQCFVSRQLSVFWCVRLQRNCVAAAETKIVAAGVHYLRIEASFYFGIGLLFLLYGYYRAIELPQMSVILTILSLGTRVLLAYALSATALNVSGIWLAVPIGWVLADIYGVLYYWRRCRKKET